MNKIQNKFWYWDRKLNYIHMEESWRIFPLSLSLPHPFFLCITLFGALPTQGWITFFILCHPEIWADNFAWNCTVSYLKFLLNQQDLCWHSSVISCFCNRNFFSFSNLKAFVHLVFVTKQKTYCRQREIYGFVRNIVHVTGILFLPQGLCFCHRNYVPDRGMYSCLRNIRFILSVSETLVF